jgi:hypothetical protein
MDLPLSYITDDCGDEERERLPFTAFFQQLWCLTYTEITFVLMRTTRTKAVAHNTPLN